MLWWSLKCDLHPSRFLCFEVDVSASFSHPRYGKEEEIPPTVVPGSDVFLQPPARPLRVLVVRRVS